MQRLWPADTGVSHEGEGSYVHFLHAGIHFHPHGRYPAYRLEPFIHNLSFVSGLTPTPLYSKISPFICTATHTKDYLRSVMWCRLLMFDQLLSGDIEHAAVPVAALVAEIARLGRPLPWVTKLLRGLPIRHQSLYIRAVRLYGVALSKELKRIPSYIWHRPDVYDRLVDMAHRISTTNVDLPATRTLE